MGMQDPHSPGIQKGHLRAGERTCTHLALKSQIPPGDKSISANEALSVEERERKCARVLRGGAERVSHNIREIKRTVEINQAAKGWHQKLTLRFSTCFYKGRKLFETKGERIKILKEQEYIIFLFWGVLGKRGGAGSQFRVLSQRPGRLV